MLVRSPLILFAQGLGYCRNWVEAMRSRLGGETEVGAVHLRVGVSGGAVWPELGDFNLVSQVNTVQTWPGFEQFSSGLPRPCIM
ncbi:hypothetical protein C8R46DRAFT_1138238, partial [Mycena filopes]